MESNPLGGAVRLTMSSDVTNSCKDTIDQLPPNHDKPRSRCVLGRNKVKRAGLDGCQLAFGLDDAIVSIAAQEEAKVSEGVRLVAFGLILDD